MHAFLHVNMYVYMKNDLYEYVCMYESHINESVYIYIYIYI